MLTSIQGVYRRGKIELEKRPVDMPDETNVIVTFLRSNAINLQERGIDETEAVDLRARLALFAEEWDSPEMSIYDDYDSAKAKL